MTRGRLSQLIFAAFLIGSLSSCVASQQPKPPESEQQSADIIPFPGAAPSAPASASTGYTLETPIERIAADPQGAAVLNKDIPGLLTNSNYRIFKSMNLKTLASLSRGKLDEQTLAQTGADLAALPKQASLAQ